MTTKRNAITSIVVVCTLLAALLATVWFGTTKAEAETAIPVYGAPSYLDGSPVGGGAGYTSIIDPSQADYVVSTAAQLKSALAAAASGQIVYVADGAVITLTAGGMYNSKTGFCVRAGVTLAGGRGRAGVTGGSIKLDPALHSHSVRLLIAIVGDNARVCGLTLIGAQEGPVGGDLWVAVYCSSGADRAEVYNNEIHGFGHSGVLVMKSCFNEWIHHNHIHHCQQTYLDGGVTGCMYGYGVDVGGEGLDNPASALIEGNVFDYCRHFVNGGRGRTSYVFRYNYMGAHAVDAQIDCHGQNDANVAGVLAKRGSEYIYCAGENIEIYNNTSVTTAGGSGKCFVGIRGVPLSTGHISVHHNWTYQTEDMRFAANTRNSGLGSINQQMSNIPEYRYNAPWDRVYPGVRQAFVRMSVYDNWYGTTAPPGTSMNRTATDTTAPAAPTLISPTSAASTSDTTPTLLWSSVTDASAVCYQIQGGTDANFSPPLISKTSLTSRWYTPTFRLSDGMYYWRVRASDAAGNTGPWSKTFSFRVDTVAPAVPKLVSPSGKAPTGDTTPLLDWSTVTDASVVHYQLKVDNNSDFSSPVVSQTWVTTSSYEVTTALRGTYYWRVRAVDAAGNTSAWSGTWYFVSQ